MGSENVAQWYTAWLKCIGPWIPNPAIQKKNQKKRYYNRQNWKQIVTAPNASKDEKKPVTYPSILAM